MFFIKIVQNFPMDLFKKTLVEDLKKHRINKDYSKNVDNLFQNGILKENMPYKALLNTFLIHMSKSSKIFENILKNNYLFDLTCYFNDTTKNEEEILNGLKKSFSDRLDYVHIEKNDKNIFIGLRFNKNIYSLIKNTDVEPYLYPYKLLLFDKSVKITDFTFDQILFTYTKPANIKIKYLEFIEHLKGLKLPLSITSDDLLFENTNILPIYDIYIYLESSSKWPKDQEAIDCAKTAFYCQLYSKSKYRHLINKDYCVFKYKNVFFNVKILIKPDFTDKYKTLIALGSSIKLLDENFYRKVHMTKTIFAKFGLYPLHFDNFFVDLICLMIWNNSIGDSKFIENLIKFDFNIFGCSFNLNIFKIINEDLPSKILKIIYKDTTYNYILPDKKYIEELKDKLSTLKVLNAVFNEDFVLQNDSQLELKNEDFDIVLSTSPIKDGFEIIGNVGNGFDLGTAEFKEFPSGSVNKMATFYYNPISNKLFAKSKAEIDINLLVNLLVLETSFEYGKF